ncbi:hypothetical protein [Clostridium sp. DL-VIII]|nr:hypothetical protein [Clostridium sp. DL-VIII]
MHSIEAYILSAALFYIFILVIVNNLACFVTVAVNAIAIFSA